MAKEFFKNLPDTTTPLTAERINGLLDSDESMGSIVVEDVTCKNLLDSDLPDRIAPGITWTGEGATHKFTSTTIFNGGVLWFFPVKKGEKYTFSYKQRNSEYLYVYIAERSNKEYNQTNVLRNIVIDYTETKLSFTIENDGYLSIYFQNSNVVSNVSIDNIQLEKGTVATEYVEHKDFGIQSGENENGSWIKFDDGTMICALNTVVTDQAIEGAYGSLYQGARNWEFPQPFVEPPTVTCSHFHWGNSASWGCVTGAPSNTNASLRGIDAFPRAAGTQVRISAAAIGKWK